MNLARRLLMAAGITPPTGQQIFGFPSGISSFLVPPGVTSVCIACVGAGVSGRAYPPAGGHGGGGSCAWTNSVAVTPGETLTVQAGGRRPYGGVQGPSESWVRRSGVNLVMAVPGSNSSGGGASSCVGVNRFSGGSGGADRGGSAAGLSGTLAAANFLEGGLGVDFGNSSWSVEYPAGNAEQRRIGANAGGGGLSGYTGQDPGLAGLGAVIIIWGPGRGFSTASNNY